MLCLLPTRGVDGGCWQFLDMEGVLICICIYVHSQICFNFFTRKTMQFFLNAISFSLHFLQIRRFLFVPCFAVGSFMVRAACFQRICDLWMLGKNAGLGIWDC